ncbi:anti-sigma factor [Neorhizobium sp. JUb45]|uniref:anti-sigma factor family protein n=1 Tax=unclassified Neorhizobium TaxID=2629175 RepID=UPI00104CA40E|nr:anti-sigma factor [Neorhizobium sp. JUb45]TCR06818.1 anti-sigma factor RsiW [Neorhizobium sp. JUb45]
MPHSQDATLDNRLSSAMDGELNELEQAEVDALLADDPQACAAQDELRRGSDFGSQAFAEVLREPVPLTLVRNIKTATPPRKAVRLPQAQSPTLPFKPTRRQAIAACALLVLAAGGIGYMIGSRPQMQTFADLAMPVTSGWLEDIATHHRVFSRQTEHLVEVPASDSPHLVDWLMATTGVSFRVPDLSAEKLEFLGGRLFSAAGKPVGQLVYRDEDGSIISICFARNLIGNDQNLAEQIRDDIGLIGWHRDQTDYVLTGPSADATLDSIAAKIAGQI